MPSSTTTTTTAAAAATTATATATTDRDRDCAVLAREALFPQQMHRLDASQYPALAALDQYRQLLRQSPVYANHPSALFPRGVVLVRDLQHNDDERLKWNGRPDLLHDASFFVVPNRLMVRCTSDCARYYHQYYNGNADPSSAPHPSSSSSLRQQPAALLISEPTTTTTDQETAGSTTTTTTLVLCTNRLLAHNKDSREPPLDSMTKELPRRSYQAVEEAVAHQVAKLVATRRSASSNTSNSTTVGLHPHTTNTPPGTSSHSPPESALADAARIELQASQMAECYYRSSTSHSRHDPVPHHHRRGSGLPRGYSRFPVRLQQYWQRHCQIETAVQHLPLEDPRWRGSSSPQQIRATVQTVYREQQQERQPQPSDH